MIRFPIEDLAGTKPWRKKRPRLRFRYLFIPLVLVSLLLFFMPDGKSGSEIIPPRGEKLKLDDLAHIDESLVQRCNLTIDTDLQRFVSETARKYKVYHGAVVVMNARTGDILAMYGTGVGGEDCRLALRADLAASVFKIVTAVAAMEMGGFRPDSLFSYTGGAHTLYKQQLTERRDRWTADISLADAFAKSNNVVFGKLGIHHLGETPVLLMAMKLGFWTSPLEEVECEPSTLSLPEDEYSLAELTSGFNRKTKITPIHAAQMASCALNGGSMVRPHIVRGFGREFERVTSKATADHLMRLMERTVKCGTLAGEFRTAATDRVLRNLTIGAKSGSIDGDDPPGRRNWFVGFAADESTGEAITIGCLLVLNGKFWIQADTFSRLIMHHYFSGRKESLAERGGGQTTHGASRPAGAKS